MSLSDRRRFLVSTSLGLGSLGLGAAAARAGLAPLRRPQDEGDERDAQDARTSPRSLERRKLGRTGMEVSVLGFGGAEIGYAGTEQSSVDNLLNAALDAGLDAIDTAECYRISEEQIGRAVAHRRKDFLLFTKVGHWPEDGWTKQGIARSLERSLERLKTDCVDLVHLHSCGVDVLEKGEALEALKDAQRAGKTRFIGYSGDSAAARFAVDSGHFDTLMTSISIADQEAIELLLPGARAKDMGVIAKRGIANAAWRYESEPDNGYHKEYWKRLVALDYDFCRGERRAAEGPEGPAGIALRFTLAVPGVHTTVVGTTNQRRFAENAALLAAGPLPPERSEAIRARWKAVAQPDWVGQI